MKKRSILALLLAFVMFFAVGCQKSGNDAKVEKKVAEGKTENKTEEAGDSIVTELDGEVEVVFWHAMGGGQEEALVALTDKFMKENPNIKINLQNQSSYGDLSQKLTSTMQSPSDLPNITQAYPDWVLPMITEGLVTDLTPYINHADKDFAFDNWDDVLQGLREGVTFDGKIYGMPFNKSTEVIWYNKTLFEELGLEVPTSFDELAEVSKKIAEAKNIPGAGFDSLANYYSTYLINKGVEFDSKLDVTGSEALEAANYYLDGIKGNYFRIAGTDKYLSGPFSNEQLGMYIGSNAGEVYVKSGVDGKFEYAAAPYPTEKSVQQGTDVYMFENSTPEEKAAAFIYLKYLTSKEAQIEWALGTGYIPVRTTAIEDPAYAESDSAIAAILVDATKNLYSRPLAPGSQQAYNDTGAMLEELLASPDNKAEDALKEFKATYDSAWQ